MLAPATHAEIRALLVGVSDYDNQLGFDDLKGPANDVRLLREVLTERGASDMTILADGVSGGTIPTHANIVQAMDALAARATKGDLVFVYLSGHGTQQPDSNGDESDGLDEVFLPTDASYAKPGSNTITNALVDDQIGQMVRRIRGTGADVWLVMDSCNSGSGLRGATPGSAVRYVDPAVFGVTAVGSGQSEAQIVETTGPDSGPESGPESGLDSGSEPVGAYLAFYSARSSELARELDFGAGTGQPQWYGLFTAKLAARLRDASGISYRQLFQAVLSDINDRSVHSAARLQTPGWDGNLIDAAVFGGKETTGLRRFAVNRGELQAGLVHGLGDGTVVALVSDATAGPDDIIGYAQLEATGATSGWLRPVTQTCAPRIADPCEVFGTLPANARFAQIVQRPIDQTLRLAPPRNMTTGAALNPKSVPAQALALAKAVETINSVGKRQITIDATSYDVESLWDGEQLWFGQRAMIGSSPVGLAVAPQTPALIAALDRISRTEEMVRLLGAIAGPRSLLLNNNPIAISATLWQVSLDDLKAPGSAIPTGRECDVAQRRAPADGFKDLPHGADLKQCDRVGYTGIGTVSGARDVNRIYIDAQYCAYVDYRRVEGLTAASRLGGDISLCSDCNGTYSAGEERLFMVVSDVTPNASPLNLQGFLETCGAQASATRGPAQQRAAAFLKSLPAQTGTRGGSVDRGASDVWVERYDWRVLPKPVAILRARQDTGNKN